MIEFLKELKKKINDNENKNEQKDIIIVSKNGIHVLNHDNVIEYAEKYLFNFKRIIK